LGSAHLQRGFLGIAGATRREIIILAISLLFGLLGAPALIYLGGTRYLGPYASDGMGTLLVAFLRGLGSGAFAFWLIALGPYALTVMVRVLYAFARYRPERPAAD
jgi:hypothetical protein